MTTSPTTDIRPEQSDIDAATHWKGIWGSFADRLPVEDLAYALARHRLTFTTPTLGDMVMVPEGMKPWHGGESAPEDWDGGGVRLRNGATMFPGRVSLAYHHNGTNRWDHQREHRKPEWDIVAYTPVAAAPASPIPISVNGAGEREELRDRLAMAISNGKWVDLADFRRWAADHSTYPNCYKSMVDERYASADRVLDLLAALSPALDNTAVEGQS